MAIEQYYNNLNPPFMDNAGLEEDSYENFAQIANPGFNLPYARQIGSGLASLFTKNPMVGLITRGIGYLGDRTRLPGVVGGADLRGDTGFDTFRRSTSFADFFQRKRDQDAREAAATRGADKQRAQDLRDFHTNYQGFFSGNQGGNGGGHAGGAAAAAGAAAQASDDAAAGAGGYRYGGLASLFYG